MAILAVIFELICIVGLIVLIIIQRRHNRIYKEIVVLQDAEIQRLSQYSEVLNRIIEKHEKS